LFLVSLCDLCVLCGEPADQTKQNRKGLPSRGRRELLLLIVTAMAGNHDHAKHERSDAPPNNNAAFAIGVALNAGFVIAEVAYGLAAHSLALISDAGHNLSDVFGLLIAWGATRLATSLPTKHRTYGWRRSSILAALC
jgi:Co/Zn/Cd efflux system component